MLGKTSPQAVRAALFDALRDMGFQPEEKWLSVYKMPAPPVIYVVVADGAVRDKVAWILRDRVGHVEEGTPLGAWFLDEREAESLCEHTR